MMSKYHRRYVRGRDASGHRVTFYVQPVPGEGAALYRSDGELIAVLPFLDGVGALRAEIRAAAMAAAAEHVTDAPVVTHP